MARRPPANEDWFMTLMQILVTPYPDQPGMDLFDLCHSAGFIPEMGKLAYALLEILS